ncbi:hypothetical protein MMC26_001949 [Xylographa opegraphella]|nr:hypothetical protein [Xylographa opegraphella]
MAYTPPLAFPMSQPEYQIRKSPFAVRSTDREILESSRAFQAIRTLLSSQQKSSFCEHHVSAGPADEEAWLLHRDITHAIILPVIHVYRQASTMAQSFLCSQSAFDLELAFRGEARGVFSWLQCLIVEEEEWCTTRGCPACVVAHVLNSEPTIRLILAACRLSRSLRKQSKEHGYPLFDFWRSSLRKVLDRDPFWGPAQAKGIEERAEQLEWGIQELILQCQELSDIVSSTEDVPVQPRILACPTPYHVHAEELIRTPSSIFSRRQTRTLLQEEQERMREIFVSCWTTLLADTTKASTAASCTKQGDTIVSVKSLTS